MSREDLSPIESLSPEVRKLIDAALNGTIDEAGLRQLDAALLDQPHVQSFFLEYCQLHIDLMIDTRASKMLDEFRLRQHATPIPPVGIEESNPLLPMSPPVVSGFLPWLAGGGAMLALVLLVGVLFWQSQDAASRRAGAFNGDLPSIQLLTGTAKVNIPNVGQVIVDGPAEFEMLNPMRARLAAGRIKMRVTEVTGHGFVVETPFGNVTDLGTEFGLDVPLEGDRAGLVVFDGEVDLEVNAAEGEASVTEAGQSPRVKRLVQGDGVTFNQQGQVERINSIVTGTVATFVQADGTQGVGQSPLIVSVSDNRRTSDTKKFYEIVRSGLHEDVKSYVDRPHEWNGVTKDGIPGYLLGADYVKTFGTDRLERNLEIRVTLAQPAKLYVFFDDRLDPPEWLIKDFRKTSDRIGLDGSRVGKGNATRKFKLETGPGSSIDNQFTIWERIVLESGTVVLGSPNTGTAQEQAAAMYGIAAVALNGDGQPESGQASSVSSDGKPAAVSENLEPESSTRS